MVSAIAALAKVKRVIIQPIVHWVPSLNIANSNDETMPLPYWSEPISAEADPAAFGAASSAAAVAVAAIMPFIENRMKIARAIRPIPPTSSFVATASIRDAVAAISTAPFKSVSRG
ncbi:hypothetical protein TUM17577_39440 [Enterobacter asburiae]|nr:hypothetical protein TUM17577_39440 [Enterobacter asburiae]